MFHLDSQNLSHSYDNGDDSDLLSLLSFLSVVSINNHIGPIYPIKDHITIHPWTYDLFEGIIFLKLLSTSNDWIFGVVGLDEDRKDLVDE